MNKLTLKFNALTTTEPWPKVEILLDDDTIEEYEFSSSSAEITIPVDLVDGVHTLSIIRTGRVDDTPQYIELVEIRIDDIAIPDVYRFRGTYYFGDTSMPGATLFEPNGRFEWKFATPIITWVLDLNIEGAIDTWEVEGSLIGFQLTQTRRNKILAAIKQFKKDIAEGNGPNEV